ncbi:MAG: ATP-dependent helicase [Anaerolineales bacterium]|nr:ATP-dependent helicase [Anaerolineales bacterium]
MGISAVPGSGKTFTLSLLAAKLVEQLASSERLDEREVLVVTFTNSAVANFRARIGGFVRSQGLLAGVGYRVRTLHGLAHDIVRERPGLVGLAEDFDIIDDSTATEIKRDAVVSYLRGHPDALAPYIKPEFIANPRRIERALVEDAIDIANTVIRVAKDLPTGVSILLHQFDQQSGAWPLLELGLRVLADYQRALTLRGAVDFDDLIMFALQALEADNGYLERLQERWPFVLEDEAQDSSNAQERMLRLLTSRNGNWVRVGDPNQAINTTFTSADTRYLQHFLREHAGGARPLPNSGRSSLPIIAAANHLITWSQQAHPFLPPDMALVPPLIEPTPPGDPQPNPAAGTPPIYLHPAAMTPDTETDMVVRSLQRWLPNNPDMTLAVLAPENHRGFALTEALQRAGLPFDDTLLRTNSTTRAAAHTLAMVLGYVAKPQQPGRLQALWTEVWYPRWAQRQGLEGFAAPGAGRRKAPLPEPVETFGRALSKLAEPEAFVFPQQTDWLRGITWLDSAEDQREIILTFRADLQRWAKAVVLPVDELLLTLGNDLFDEPADLALTHRLAVLLAKLQDEQPGLRLPDLANELENIALNKRRILGFGEDAQGYQPLPGVVTVATMHAAKGLEWDRVYLTSVNNYSFPGGGEADSYRSERWFIRDRLNLLAEVEAQMHQLHGGTLDDYLPGQATARADRAGSRAVAAALCRCHPCKTRADLDV